MKSGKAVKPDESGRFHGVLKRIRTLDTLYRAGVNVIRKPLK
jgi:hypothetical protein